MKNNTSNFYILKSICVVSYKVLWVVEELFYLIFIYYEVLHLYIIIITYLFSCKLILFINIISFLH